MVKLSKAKHRKGKGAKHPKAPRKARPRRIKAEQPYLIPDVLPENAKQICKVAIEYREAMQARQALSEIQHEHKATLLSLVKDAKLKPADDGTISFEVDGLRITVTPRDELIRVKDSSGDEAGGDDADGD